MEVFDGGYTHPAFYYFSAYKKGLKVYPALSFPWFHAHTFCKLKNNKKGYSLKNSPETWGYVGITEMSVNAG